MQVALPTPSLSGGIGSDQLAAYSGDWDVYWLLALVRSHKLTVAFSHSSYVLMTYRVVGRCRAWRLVL